MQKEKMISEIKDFATGRKIPLSGAEDNRQAFERFLVEKKGYSKQDIDINVKIGFEIDGIPYRSSVDVVVSVNGTRIMATKCAAGSLGSREREILAAARLLDRYQIPFSVVSDGNTAIMLDTVTGKIIGQTLEAVWSKKEAAEFLEKFFPAVLPDERVLRERLIFRTYDSMNVNVIRDNGGT